MSPAIRRLRSEDHQRPDGDGNSLRLKIVPCHLDEANSFVEQWHRHHKPTQGGKFAVSCADEDGTVRGVAIVGRPVSRMLDDGWTLEVTRVATDGAKNACSALYSAAWRVTREMGYRKLVTYILDTEAGTSLRAVGWKTVGETGGGSWSRGSRPRVDKHPTQGKIRYEVSSEFPTEPCTDKASSGVSTERGNDNV